MQNFSRETLTPLCKIKYHLVISSSPQQYDHALIPIPPSPAFHRSVRICKRQPRKQQSRVAIPCRPESRPSDSFLRFRPCAPCFTASARRAAGCTQPCKSPESRSSRRGSAGIPIPSVKVPLIIIDRRRRRQRGKGQAKDAHLHSTSSDAACSVTRISRRLAGRDDGWNSREEAGDGILRDGCGSF